MILAGSNKHKNVNIPTSEHSVQSDNILAKKGAVKSILQTDHMKKRAYLIAFGLLLGILTSYGQTYLPEPMKQFANSFSVWLLVSFICGFFTATRKQALSWGATTQVIALFVYYLVSNLRFGSGYGSATIVIFWLMGGVVMGPILSEAGRVFYRRLRGKALAVTAMTGVILLEAAYMLLGLHYISKSLCFLGLALGFFVITSLYSQSSLNQSHGEDGVTS